MATITAGDFRLHSALLNQALASASSAELFDARFLILLMLVFLPVMEPQQILHLVVVEMLSFDHTQYP